MKQKNILFVLLLTSVHSLKPIPYATIAKGLAAGIVLNWYVKKYNAAYGSRIRLERARQEQIDHLVGQISEQSLEIFRLRDNSKQWQEYGKQWQDHGMRMQNYIQSLELKNQDQEKTIL